MPVNLPLLHLALWEIELAPDRWDQTDSYGQRYDEDQVVAADDDDPDTYPHADHEED